jgi:hypothetical protein
MGPVELVLADANPLTLESSTTIYNPIRAVNSGCLEYDDRRKVDSCGGPRAYLRRYETMYTKQSAEIAGKGVNQ